MLVTAFERALPRAAAASGPVRLRLVGFPGALETPALEAALGAKLDPEPLGAPPASLRDAFEKAQTDQGPTWIGAVIADVGSERSIPPPGAGAAILLVEEGPHTAGFDLSAPPFTGEHGPDGAVAGLFAQLRSAPKELARTGDWAADAGRGLPAAKTGTGSTRAPLSSVSQGAFVPRPTDEANRASRWRFIAQKCPSCGGLTFPARGRCRACGRRDSLVDEPLPLDGATVVATTWIGAGGQPTEYDAQVEATGPYGVVIAELAPGVRATLAVSDATRGEVRIGSKVDTRLRRLYPIEGGWRYGRKAVPALRTPT